MRAIAAAFMLLASVSPAVAQTAAGSAQAFDPAPWWMDRPIIASTGLVQMKLVANRASFSTNFNSVAKTTTEATEQAVNKVKGLANQLAAFGVDKVRIETTFDLRPIYDQYRDKDGKLIDNERADKIEAYEATADISVEVYDVAVIEKVYGAAVAARPTYIDEVTFTLEPDNATKTELFGLAVADAAQRAKLAVEATGARLGAVKLIDPTGRACDTDVLVERAPRPSPVYESSQYSSTERKRRAVTPTDSIVSDFDWTNPAFPLQPPLLPLNAKACVVYSLGG